MANRAVPIIVQLVMFYLVISWLVRLARRHRKPQAGLGQPSVGKTTAAAPRPPSPATPRFGGFRREERMYNGVVWQIVHRPHRDLSAGAGSRAAGDEIYVEEPPRCPKCGLGVVETHSWLGYTWACPECGTRARSSVSIEATARMLARRG